MLWGERVMTKNGTKAPTIDRAALDENTMGDEELQRELFEIFFGQAPALYDRMLDAMKRKDGGAWRSTAHAFKGSSRALGLERIAALAARAEDGTMNRVLLRAFAVALDEAREAAVPFMRAAA